MLVRCAALTAFALLSRSAAWAGPYDVASQRAADWLIQQRNAIDGSFGTRDDVRYVQTAEAAIAFRAINRRGPEYYAALTWLQNHQPRNVDDAARRILALQANGMDVSADLQRLQAAQQTAAPANGGVGLTQTYQGAALDSALALQAYAQTGVSPNATAAISFLKSAQLNGADPGWALGQEEISDPVTTAQAIIALVAYRANDVAIAASIANALGAINIKVGPGSAAVHRALAAIANLSSSVASQVAPLLLSDLLSTQRADGSWDGDPYATALAIRALAAAMAADVAALSISVSVPDQNLRSAINLALGRSSLDSITRGDLANLTTLDISGRGIKTLTGLEWALNLTTLIAPNNDITSTALRVLLAVGFCYTRISQTIIH